LLLGGIPGLVYAENFAAQGQNTTCVNCSVGIGIATPASKLHVFGTTNILATVESSQAGAQGTGFDVRANSRRWTLGINIANLGSGKFFIYDATAGVAASRLMIDTLGNVGIGTNSPVSRLHVVTADQAQVSIESTGPTATDTAVDFRTTSRRWVMGINVFGLGAGKLSVFDVTVQQQRLIFDLDGTVTVTGNLVVNGNIAAKYQDVAEWVRTRDKMMPGTVVVLDQTTPDRVMSSMHSYDTKVAGVVSTQPGVTLGEPAEDKALIATTGRVKVRANASNGAIRIGDLLVTSEREGAVMRSEPVSVSGVFLHRPGTLIGKALESLEAGEGEILVLLSLQ
jgi:hypothetical protein